MKVIPKTNGRTKRTLKSGKSVFDRPQAVKKNTSDWAGFSDLRPLNLAKCPESTMVVPLSRRPYLSIMAKGKGIKYTTFPLPDGENMLVLHYSLGKHESKTKG